MNDIRRFLVCSWCSIQYMSFLFLHSIENKYAAWHFVIKRLPAKISSDKWVDTNKDFTFADMTNFYKPFHMVYGAAQIVQLFWLKKPEIHGLDHMAI